MTAGELSSVLVSGEVRRSRHKLDTEKSLHLPEELVLLLVVVEFVVDINMMTRGARRRFSQQFYKTVSSQLMSLEYHFVFESLTVCLCKISIYNGTPYHSYVYTSQLNKRKTLKISEILNK